MHAQGSCFVVHVDPSKIQPPSFLLPSFFFAVHAHACSYHCLCAAGSDNRGARGGKFSLWRSLAGLRLARFDGKRNASVDNLVLLAWPAAEAHYASG